MSCTNCKICDAPLIDKGKLDWRGVHQYRCPTDHFIHNGDESGETVTETFKYGKYKVITWYYQNEIIEYGLYHPYVEGRGSQLCLSAYKVKFDPKNPENIINKLKTIVNFS